MHNCFLFFVALRVSQHVFDLTCIHYTLLAPATISPLRAAVFRPFHVATSTYRPKRIAREATWRRHNFLRFKVRSTKNAS